MTKPTFAEVLKFNPYHDKFGKFSSPEGGGGGGVKSILDIPREQPKAQEPDKWADFDALGEAVKRLSVQSYKGTKMTAENGFTFEKHGRYIHVQRDGKLLGKSKWVWTKKGPQFHVGGWFAYQHYPTYS